MPPMRDCRRNWWDSDSIFLFPFNETKGLDLDGRVVVRILLARGYCFVWGCRMEVVNEGNGASLEGGAGRAGVEKEAER